MDLKGKAIKNSSYIDIPLEICFPHFVPSDDTMDEEPQMGNFKLSLQSIICHHGNSVHHGHYFSYIRAAEVSDGDLASARRMSSSSLPPSYPVDRWIRHNDLKDPRVSSVDISQVLREETPYLLFYQVQPIFDDLSQAASAADLAVDLAIAPPSYDSGIDIQFTESSPQVDRNPFHALMRQQEEEHKLHQPGYFDGAREGTTQSNSPSIRLSSELERPMNSTLPEGRRGSLAFTDTSLGSAYSVVAPEFISQPVTPNEESTAQRLSRAASRFRKGSRSRPTSSSGESRIAENRTSATFSRLAARSKEQLNKMELLLTKDVPPIPATGSIDRPEPAAVTVKEVALKPSADAVPSRKTSKRGRKQEKLEKKAVETEKDHHHHNHKKVKGKEALVSDRKQVPERECIIM